jgi:hypothetical protein
MKNKPFKDLAEFSRGKSFRKAKNSEKRKFQDLAIKCLREIRSQLKHEQSFLNAFNSYGEETKVTLQTNRVYIEVSKVNDGESEVIYRHCNGLSDKSGSNRFVSIERISENPAIFVDRLKILCFSG